MPSISFILFHSGARIQSPCNRQCPLSYYASKYGNMPYSASNSSIGSGGINSPSPIPGGGAFRFNQSQNTYRSPMSSPPRTKRDVPPRLPSKKQRSQSLTPAQQQQSQIQRIINVSSNDKYNSIDGLQHHQQRNKGDENQEPNGQMFRSIENVDEKATSADGIIISNGNHMSHSTSGLKFASNSLPRHTEPSPNPKNRAPVPPRTSSLNRNGSTSSLNVDKTPNSEELPPPKPVKDRGGKDDPIQRVASYHPSGSDSGNGSGDSAQSSTTGEEINQNRCGVIIKNPRFIPNSLSSVTLKSFADIDPHTAEETFRTMEIPYIEQISQFDMENFHTVLLPCSEFKPLDTGTLTTFRMMISENSPRVIATHITRVDIKHILGTTKRIKFERK